MNTEQRIGSWLCLSRVKVNRANIQTAGWVIGGPPVMPAVLLGHALARRFQVPVSGVAVIHHRRRLRGDWIIGNLQGSGESGAGLWHPEQRRAAAFTFTNDKKKDYAGGGASLSAQPVATADLLVSLVIAFPADQAVSLDQGQIGDWLSHSRLAGGSIQHCNDIFVAATSKEKEDLEYRLRRSGGFFVRNRPDLLAPSLGEQDPGVGRLLVGWLGQQPSKEDRAPTDSSREMSSPLTAEENEERGCSHRGQERALADDGVASTNGKGGAGGAGGAGDGVTESITGLAAPSWLAPACLGYGALEALQVRPGAREGHLHALAEPLIGLVQYQSVKHLENTPLEAWVWQPRWDDTDFLLTQPFPPVLPPASPEKQAQVTRHFVSNFSVETGLDQDDSP